MRRADKLGARYSVVIGENEVASGKAAFKRMKDGEQIEVPLKGDDIKNMLE
jgi:histidyl-tRNA synthetase